MSKAIQGAAMLAGAVGMGVATFLDPALLASPMWDKLWASLIIGGISMEAGALAGALTSNRGMGITTRQPAAFRQIIYGTQRVGGVSVYQSTTGSHHDQYNYIIVLAGHEVDAIVDLFLDGRQVFWQGSGPGWSIRNGIGFGGNPDDNTHIGPGGQHYKFHSLVYCEARFGDQQRGDVISGMTANDPVWIAGPGGSPYLGGCCYVYLKIEYDAAMFPQLPEVRFTVRGKNNIYDPRTGTRGYSDNWALVVADVITDSVFGLGDNTVNEAQLIAAANVCDELVTLANAQQEARYKCHYHYDTSAGPGDILDTMLPAAAGRLSRIGGEWYIWPAYWQGPSFSFAEDILTGPLQWTPNRSFRDLFNRVNGTYIAPNSPYNVAGNLYDGNGWYDGSIANQFPFAFQPTNYPQYAQDVAHGYASDQWLAEDTGAVPAWDSGTTYASGDTVSYGGTYWQSQVNSNVGNTPVVSPGPSAPVALLRPTTLLNGWGNNAHVGAYEEGVDQGYGWGLNNDTTYPYVSPGLAIDTSETTAASIAYSGTHKYAGCVWQFGALGSTPPHLYLNVLSKVDPAGGTGRSAGIWYSLDNGVTWVQIYNTPTHPLGWDSIFLDPTTDTSQIQVMAFTDAHDDMAHYVYDVQLSQAQGTEEPWLPWPGNALPKELVQSCVLSIAQAQRCAKITLLRNRFQGSGAMPMHLEAWQMQPLDVMQFTFPPNGWTNKLLEIAGTKLTIERNGEDEAPSIRFAATVQETDPSIYEWSTGEEVSIYGVTGNPAVPPYTIDPPSNLVLLSDATTAVIGADGVNQPRILATWTAPPDVRVTQIQIQHQVHASGNWIDDGAVDVATTSKYIAGVVSGTIYDVRIRSLTNTGATSVWVETDNVTAFAPNSLQSGYTIDSGTIAGPYVLSQPSATEIDLAACTASFGGLPPVNYSARAFTIPTPPDPSVAGNPTGIWYYITIADPTQRGESGPTLTATCQASDALVGVQGNTYMGAIYALYNGGAQVVLPGGWPSPTSFQVIP